MRGGGMRCQGIRRRAAWLDRGASPGGGRLRQCRWGGGGGPGRRPERAWGLTASREAHRQRFQIGAFSADPPQTHRLSVVCIRTRYRVQNTTDGSDGWTRDHGSHGWRLDPIARHVRGASVRRDCSNPCKVGIPSNRRACMNELGTLKLLRVSPPKDTRLFRPRMRAK